MTIDLSETPATIAISISESPDLGPLGLSKGHLLDAMADVALKMLSGGRSLAYGGDLRRHGFTELLFDSLVRYRDHPRHSGTIEVTNYVAWPVHVRMTAAELAQFSAAHEVAARLVLLARDGAPITPKQRLALPTHEPDHSEWSEGLTAMRNVMRDATQARIVLGGQVTGFKGAMPGIAEETLISLRAGHPVYLIGGYGGCARDIAETIGLVPRWAGSRGEWLGRERFCAYSADDLRNGLSLELNAVLARTPHIRQALEIVSHGLRKILG